jgi:predicted transcriptional regulator of viral defense system
VKTQWANLQAQHTTFTYKTATDFGLDINALEKATKNGEIERLDRGIYVFPNVLEDRYATFSQRFSKGVFSGLSARDLHDMTEEAPFHYEMTFPKGYNNPNLARLDIHTRHQVQNRFELGIETVKTPYGNTARVYSPERTMLDTWEREDVSVEVRKYAYHAYLKLVRQNMYRLQQLIELQQKLYPHSNFIKTLEVDL